VLEKALMKAVAASGVNRQVESVVKAAITGIQLR
jgi:hypothetical protein